MVAIYARQSVEKKESISIETQIEYAKREAGEEETKVYQDSGFSGKNTNRPAFMQMMQDIDRGIITKVAVYRLDRISRSILDFGDFINILEDKGVSFASATEKFDTSTPMGRAMLYIVVVFAQLERETIAERIKDNYYARVKKGYWGGGAAPYGFDLERIVKDGKPCSICKPNKGIEAIKRMFELYSQPYTSLAAVAKQLDAEGFRTQQSKSWSSAKISLILHNPIYVRADMAIYNFYISKGVIMANDPEEFDGAHGCILVGERKPNERKFTNVANHLLAITYSEGIVDSSVFLYCQQKMSHNKQLKNTGKGKYSWLTGIIKCGRCGYALAVNSIMRKSGVSARFVCTGRALYHNCDVKKSYSISDIETEVEARIISQAAQYRLIHEQKNTDALKKCEAEIFDLDGRIENLISSLESAGSVAADYIGQRVEALHREKQELLRRHSELLCGNNAPEIPPFTAEDWEQMTLEDKRDIARVMLDRVVVYPDRIDLEFK